MFKSGKATKPARKPGSGAAMMKQMGFQMPNFDGSGMGGDDDDDDDDDLEAELQKLQGFGGGNGSKSKQRKTGGTAPDLQAFHSNVNKLLHDIDQPMNDDDLSDVDEDDLLAELNEITEDIETEEHGETKKPQASSSGNILSVLQGRQDMYTKAIAAAKASGDATKSRRLERQLKTIQDLLQSARSGAQINEGDIPPEVFVAGASTSAPQSQSQQVPVRAPSPPPQPRPLQPPQPQPIAVNPRAVHLPQPQPPPSRTTSVPKQDNSVAFRTPQPQPPPTSTNSDPAVARLKALALQAKQRGDMAQAKEYIIQLRALQNKTTTAAPPPPPASSIQKESYDNVPDDDDDDSPPPPMPLKAPEPNTIMEALQQRHEELTKKGEEAAVRGDTSKTRRMERLSKQYQEAIVATRKGQAYNYAELPDIPGFAPIPVQQSKPQQPAPSSSAAGGKPTSTNAQGRPSQSQQQRPVPLTTSTSSTSARKSQQAQALRLKQEQFQKLALQAKQQGDIESAKKFLYAYKGLEQMITAAESGLPVDMSQVPKLPDDDTVMINDDDLTQDLAHADRDTIYRRLQDDLLRQIQLCARNQQIYDQMEGTDNSKHANEYKILEQRCAQELEKLRHGFQHGLKPPLFHYERKQMNIVQSNNDLGENDLEVNILRGINLPVPAGTSSSSLETFVMIEFPYPTDEPQIGRTRHAGGSSNAEYPDSIHKFYIKRNDAKFRRLMNRKELKLAVFYKPGFLRSDRPLGTASIKLAALEQQCTIHESVDLYECEHKKKIEGKLEVKLRIKEALGQTKASDILPQRWLVIDRFGESESSKSSSSRAPAITAIASLVPTGVAFGEIAINMAGNKDDNEKVPPSSKMNDHQRRRSNQHPVAAAVPTTTTVRNPVVTTTARNPVVTTTAPARNSVSTSNISSVQILNYEASLLQQQIEQLHDRLTPEQLHQLKTKHRGIQEQADRLVESLRMGGKQAVNEHVRGLHDLIDYYDQQAREYHQQRETKKADMCLTKKKLAMKEIDSLSGPPSSTRF